MKRSRGAQPNNQNARVHGLYAKRQALSVLDGPPIDRRYRVGRALAEWRSKLVRDLGGEGSVSTQQEALVDLAVKSKLMLDSIDNWLLTRPTLINQRKKTLLPVVRERQALADGLARYLGQLGLERRVKEPKDLASMLSDGGSE